MAPETPLPPSLPGIVAGVTLGGAEGGDVGDAGGDNARAENVSNGQARHGNVAFEAAAWYRADALDQIAALGGIDTLSCSHPHGMGALWQLQQRFAPRVVPMHVDGLRYTKAFRVTWPWDDALELAPGLVLHHVGGHYEGHAVLHDAGRRALFAGDTLKIDLDAEGRPRALSCHKAYHYAIPLSHGELRHYRRVFAGLPFEHVFTPFEHATGVTQAHALALFDRLLAGAPSTAPVPLEELVP